MFAAQATGCVRSGCLYLRNGDWSGQQIIPASWFERAKGGQVLATFGLHHANLWWSLPEKGRLHGARPPFGPAGGCRRNGYYGGVYYGMPAAAAF